MNSAANQTLTGVVIRFFTTSAKVDHYRTGMKICLVKENPAAELRQYYAAVTKIRKSDVFAQVALDAVNWNIVADLWKSTIEEMRAERAA